MDALINVACLSTGTKTEFVTIDQLKEMIMAGSIDLYRLREKAELYNNIIILELLEEYVVNGIPSLCIDRFDGLDGVDFDLLNDLEESSEAQYKEPDEVEYESTDDYQ